jgi:hypothetical protein
MISISSPSTDGNWVSPFDVSGSCDSQHMVTVTTQRATVTRQAMPTKAGDWSVSFGADNVPANTYTITAKCGDPEESASVTNVTVT